MPPCPWLCPTAAVQGVERRVCCRQCAVLGQLSKQREFKQLVGKVGGQPQLHSWA